MLLKEKLQNIPLKLLKNVINDIAPKLEKDARLWTIKNILHSVLECIVELQKETSFWFSNFHTIFISYIVQLIIGSYFCT